MNSICPITDKVRYARRALAKYAAAQIVAKRGDSERVERSVYGCIHCDGWHLSSMPQAAVNKRSKEDRKLRRWVEERT